MEAAARRAERDSQRRYRQLERDAQARAKTEGRQMAALEVELFESQIDRLLSVHKETPETWDWSAICNTPPPVAPERTSVQEAIAAAALDAYSPGLFDKLLGKAEAKRQALAQALELAKGRDEQEYQRAYQAYYNQHVEWDERRQLAQRILQGDTQAYVDALVDFNPFADISELGASIEFKPHNAQLVEVRLVADGERLVPDQVKSLTSTGKLSTKPMPKGQFFDIYRDFVCGVALRAARELFAFLPVQTVLVNVQAHLLNTRTGHQSLATILSAALSRSVFAQLNFNRLDPSDAMEGFPHNVSFRKASGFEAVEPLSGEQPRPDRRTTLYCRAGTSDKVYEVSLQRQGIAFVVNFAYGRRGFPLKTGSKTSEPVTFAVAEAIYEALIREKLGRGYTEDPTGISHHDGATERVSYELETSLQRLLTEYPELSGAHYLPAGRAASLLGIAEAAKLSISDCRELTNAIENSGYCVEPDARFGGGAYAWNQVVGVFKSTAGESAAPSPAYHGAANLLRLCVLVAAADGAVDKHELGVFRQVIESQLHFSQTELKRLAVLERVLADDPTGAAKTLSKVSKAIPSDKRLLVGQVIVKVAAVDHVITKSEFRALERVFKAFELPAQTLTDLMLRLCPAPAETTIQEPGAGAAGETIPPREEPRSFALDMSKVYAITNETQAVVGILSAVMEDEAAEAAPPRGAATPATVTAATEPVRDRPAVLPGAEFAGLDPAFHPVLERLLAKESWPRSEFHELAAQFHLMPLSIHDVLNEWADESLGDFLLEGEDPIVIRRELVLKETT